MSGAGAGQGVWRRITHRPPQLTFLLCQVAASGGMLEGPSPTISAPPELSTWTSESLD